MIPDHTQYLLSKDHQHHRWQLQKSWTSFQNYRDAQDKQQMQYPLIPGSKWKMHRRYWKFQSQNVQIFGYVYRNTDSPNSWSSMEDPVVPLDRNLHGHPLAGLLREKAVRENPFEIRLGENSKLGMSLCSPWKRVILICVCGWHKIGWKETEHQSVLENSHVRRWFGRTNVVPGPCLFGLHSKKIADQQGYFG